MKKRALKTLFSDILVANEDELGSADKEFESYRIKGAELKELLEFKGNSIYSQLEKDIPKLMKTYIALETDDGKGKEWISLMSSAKYSKGDLYIKFNDAMKPYLLELQSKFTQCKLMDVMKFKSMYSLRLFLLLKQFDTSGWRWMDLHELRECLNLNENQDYGVVKGLYPKVFDFKKRVLLPALEELNSAGFKVEAEEIKEGKKITAYKFTWNGFKDVQRIDFQPKNDTAARLLERLKAVGLNDTQIKKLGDWMGAGIITAKEMNQTIWGIEKLIRDKNITKEKMGGYAYKTFKGKFNLPNF